MYPTDRHSPLPLFPALLPIAAGMVLLVVVLADTPAIAAPHEIPSARSPASEQSL
jgi:hypothetical protein